MKLKDLIKKADNFTNELRNRRLENKRKQMEELALDTELIKLKKIIFEHKTEMDHAKAKADQERLKVELMRSKSRPSLSETLSPLGDLFSASKGKGKKKRNNEWGEF